MVSSQAPSQVQGTDWRVPNGEPYPTEAGLSVLKCPFEIDPLRVDQIPAEYCENVEMCRGTDTPWDRFYTTAIPQHPATVANAYGVWFKIRKRTIGSIGLYKAFRLARPMFLLKNWPMTGIDMYQLEISGEVQQTTATTPSPFGNTDANEPRAQLFSKTERGRRESNLRFPRKFFGGSDDEEEKPRDDKYVRLEGILPKEFDGDQSKTHQFLIQFKHFM